MTEMVADVGWTVAAVDEHLAEPRARSAMRVCVASPPATAHSGPAQRPAPA
eukprot:CAMPEP_0205998340 /NCGR_PEP_ID=MMETSP1464-20131121/188_1 /ASSEMBLY_ACC=CAM_ASM_001124 /TAXON_ID=119497 /ORGANISM="Exanthemachrysis gayraliae, Strain RCC1523" /LENGTH=50 /DNA_ID=CAMNT_0053371483 /DNA_START=242 /DNA_END=389 /DNA_ORIENTATION=-